MGKKEYIFSNYLYPIISGFILAYFVSSIIKVAFYRVEITSPIVSRSSMVIHRQGYTKDILANNVFHLRVGTTKKVKSKVQIASGNLSKFKLMGTVAGKNAFAVLKKGKHILILKKGSRVDGYILEDINFDGITLMDGNRKVVLKFKKSNKFSKSTSESATLNKVVFKREEILNAYKNINKILTTVNIVPFYKSGKFSGYQINTLRNGSFLYRIGLRSGDIIVKINGEKIDSPNKLMEMLSKLNDMTAVNIDLLRRGERKTIFVEVED